MTLMGGVVVLVRSRVIGSSCELTLEREGPGFQIPVNSSWQATPVLNCENTMKQPSTVKLQLRWSYWGTDVKIPQNLLLIQISPPKEFQSQRSVEVGEYLGSQM